MALGNLEAIKDFQIIANSLNDQDTNLALSYAALILADDDVEITGGKLQAILEAANIQIQPFWFRNGIQD